MVRPPLFVKLHRQSAPTGLPADIECMTKLIHQVKQKTRAAKNRKISVKEAFRNEGGAIDLASIMVGIIVIGLIGGVIAATVFAVIPWSQDNAAKHQLDSIVAAQSAYMGLASDSPSALPAGHKANSFANSELLASANLLQKGSTYCAVTTDEGKGYQGFSQSSSGVIWTVTNKNTKPVTHDKIESPLPSDCSFIAEGHSTDNDDSVKAPYTDPTPTVTSLTYKCDVTTKGHIPLATNIAGTETWSDGDVKSYVNVSRAIDKELLAGVTYKVSFDGTYNQLSSFTSKLAPCLRSMDHWGSATGATSASYGFYQSPNLVSVPEHIPSSVTNAEIMLYGTTSLNDPNISRWDVSEITNMRQMFQNASSFNQPLNDWNMSKVENIHGMFLKATDFNQSLDRWDTSNITNMTSAFSLASDFNGDITTWNVTKVTEMTYLLNGATSFNHDLSKWNTSSLTYIQSLSAPASYPLSYLPPSTRR